MRQAEPFTGSIWSYWAMQDEGWHVKVLQILRSWLKTHVGLPSDDLRVEVWEEMIDDAGCRSRCRGRKRGTPFSAPSLLQRFQKQPTAPTLYYDM